MFSLDDSHRYWFYNSPVNMRLVVNVLSSIVANRVSLPRSHRRCRNGRCFAGKRQAGRVVSKNGETYGVSAAFFTANI